MSGPWLVLAATLALGCTSSSDSLMTLTSTPVALVNAATSAMKLSSSLCTKRFQRSSDSAAPGSGLNGDACAQAAANSARLALALGAGKRCAGLEGMAAGDVAHRCLLVGSWVESGEGAASANRP